MQNKILEERLRQYAGNFAPVVPFVPLDKLLLMDFTEINKELTDEVVKDTNKFIQYINRKLGDAGAKYGIGGYGENRTIYRRSEMFGSSGPSGPLNPPVGDLPPHNASPINDSTSIAESLQSKGLCMDFLPTGEAEGAGWEEDPITLAEEDTVGYRHADPYLYRMLKEYASQNRGNPTQAEEVLWNALKTKQLNGYRFRRQHIIDKFITDFVCLKKRVVIEVDGLIHQLPGNKESDEYRTNVLNDLGFTVLRFTNDEVLFQLQTVTTRILKALEQSNVFLQPILSDKAEENKDASTGVVCALGSPPPGDLGGRKVGMSRVVGVEPRTLHLGIDIWGAPYTRVMAPLNGIVHSFAFNNAYGDYGATIILTHNLDGATFHTLYGHLSLNSIKNLHEGQNVYKGDVIAEFGIPFENGQWPPHLHFQIIKDMQGAKGDYPGVCALSEREKYLSNCPDANLILDMMKYAT